MEKEPTKLFNNKKEWEDEKKILYTEIYNTINKHVVLDVVQYREMTHQGLTISQILCIGGVIERGLTILTNEPEWSKQIAWDIMYGISGFFNGLINSNNWGNIYNLLSAQDLANIIYKNIEWQLDDGKHSPCILEHAKYFQWVFLA
jgi:hypothetical protein